jgi:hypothetical protein
MAGHQVQLVADVELVGGGGRVANDAGPESRASAFKPASTITRFCAGRLKRKEVTRLR